MSAGNENVWVIIAAFNEQEVIASVLKRVTALGYTVVVVDDCSSDRTVEQVAACPVHLLRHGVNLGQGAALQTGIRYALAKGAGFLVTFDADGQHSPEEIATMVAPLRRGEVEATLGTRFAEAGSAVDIPRRKYLLLKCAISLTRFCTGLNLTDTHNGFRAFTAHAARRLHISRNRMAHASQILSQISKLRLSYTEVPVTISYTDYSVRKGQRMSNSFNIIWESLMDFFKI